MTLSQFIHTKAQPLISRTHTHCAISLSGNATSLNALSAPIELAAYSKMTGTVTPSFAAFA